MISYEEALHILLAETLRNTKKEIIEVSLLDSVNCILAEDVFSDTDLPSFTNSSMDGFAIIYSDASEWKITGEISAGNFQHFTIDTASAVRIMTGGKIPQKADTVIPLEDVIEQSGAISLRNNCKVKQGQFIRLAGEDLHKNSIALPRDVCIQPQHIALLATCGKAKVKIYKPLTIGVFSTGDELIEIETIPVADKIRATNIYTILAAIKNLNMHAINVGFTKDDKQLIRQKVETSLQTEIDILITTGGVSVGKYDYLKEVFTELGIEILFDKVNIRPGKPCVFGRYEKNGNVKYVFGLPGNPVSSFATFTIFVKLFIQHWFNQKSEKTITAILQSGITKSDTKRHFVRGTISNLNGAYEVIVQGKQSSGNLAGLGLSNCLIVMKEDRNILSKGDLVECILL